MDCQNWCGSTSNNKRLELAEGDPLCCRYDYLSYDRSYCHLYKGNQAEEHVLEGNEIIAMMEFTYGSQEDNAFALKTAFGALAAIAVIMQ